MTVKHFTASVFVFDRASGDAWRLGLVHHPQYGRWMLPGGHVEAHENPAEAALRELGEETGLTATLLAPAPMLPPRDFSDPVVPLPHWIVEERTPGDRELGPHVHVDFLYVALARAPSPPSERSAVETLPFAWIGRSDMDRLDMFAGTRTLARELFASIDALVRRMPADRSAP